MVSQNKIDIGYQYTLALCSAIEKFTTYQEIKNPKIFYYQGSNLKYALERALYFSYINNDYFYKIYSQYYLNNGPQQIYVKNQLEKYLLSYLCQNIDINNILISEKKLKSLIKKVLRITMSALKVFYIRMPLFFLKKQFHKKSYSNKIILFVMSKKFLDYSQEIVQKIGPNLIGYFTFNKNIHNLLKKNNLLNFFYKTNRIFYRFIYSDSFLNQFGLLEKYDIISKFIDCYRPQKIIIFEGNSSFDEIANQVAKKYGIISICIQQGWSPIIHNGFRNMSYSKMLTWGNGFSNLLQPFNPQQKFIATGSHSILFQTKKVAFNPEKMILLFFIQETSRLFDTTKQDIFISLIHWISDKFPLIKIIVAGKGGYQISSQVQNFHNVEIVEKANEIPLYEILSKGNILISAYSTVILDALASNILPIIFNVTSMPHYSPNITNYKAGMEVKNIDQIKKIISDLYNNKINPNQYQEGMAKFRAEYFTCDRQEALDNIVREIIS